MERTFQKVDRSIDARRGYVEAEVTNSLANQIRVLRQQRKWSQKDLAKFLCTTQGVVSRLEDPSYGKASLQTLLCLSTAFDTALNVRFESFGSFFARTHDIKPDSLKVLPYEVEREFTHVVFDNDCSFGQRTDILISENQGTTPIQQVTQDVVGPTLGESA